MPTLPLFPSNAFITNLNASLNNVAHGWSVCAAGQPGVFLGETAPADYSATLMCSGLGAPFNLFYASNNNQAGPPIGSLTFYTPGQDFAFAAGAVPQYIFDGSVSPGTTLDATIRALAYTYLNNQLTNLNALITGSPVAPVDPLAIPAPLLSDINASLILPAAGWSCLGRTEGITQLQQIVNGAIAARQVRIIGTTLRAANRTTIVGSTNAGLVLCYTQQLDYISGNLLMGTVNVLGGTWRTLDATLQSEANALAVTFLSTQAAAVEAVLP